MMDVMIGGNPSSRPKGQGSGYTLPVALAPHSDESGPSLVMRDAAVYQFHDPLRIFRRIRPPKLVLWTLFRTDPGTELGQGLATTLGLSAETFRRLSMWTGSDTTLSVLGHPIWRELVRPSTRAVCPLCLREAAYHRAVWFVYALPVCAVHGAWLIDHCPNPKCRRTLSWTGFAVHRCGARECRHDLLDASVHYSEPELLGGITAIHRLLHGENLDTPLGMPVGEAVTVAFILGQIAFGFERETRPPGFIRRHLRQIPEFMNVGWRALDDWPNGFHALLDRLRTRASERAGKDGLRKAFGTLSLRVYGWAREPWGGPIGQAFGDYVAAQSDLATTANTLRRYAPGADLRYSYVSLTEGQKLLNIGPATLQAIAERRDMYILPPRGSGTPALLRADTLQELRREMQDFLLPEEARVLLGVGRRVAHQLEDAGLVRCVPEPERVMASHPYRRSDLEALISSCVGRAPRRTRAQADELGVTKLTRAVAPGRSVVDICWALVERRLRSVTTVSEDRGLMRLRLRLSDVERVLPAQRQTLSIVEAALQLGTNYEGLHVWAHRGFLKTVRSPRRGERGLRITAEAWVEFRQQYVTGGELGKLFGQEGNFQLSRHLRFLGVLPVSGPGTDSCKVSLFRRSDCTPEVMEAVRRIQARLPCSPQDKHPKAFNRVARAAAEIESRWGCKLKRANNRFEDPATGRTVQIVGGRRPEMTGVFIFHVRQQSLAHLRALSNAWVALVPSQGNTFLLLPCEQVQWRGEALEAGYVTVRFDGRGQPLEMAAWAVELPEEGPESDNE
jgi:hypothetical protein